MMNKVWLKKWSTWWDAVEYAVMAYFIAYPTEVKTFVGFLPESLQAFAAFVIPIVLFSAKTKVKLIPQGGRDADVRS